MAAFTTPWIKNLTRPGLTNGSSSIRSTYESDDQVPFGLIATPIIEMTAAEVPDLDWHAVILVAEAIKSDPFSYPKEAIDAIKYRLSHDDPVSIYYTLSLLDTFYKNCGAPFVQAVVKEQDFFRYEFLHRKSLASENRGQMMELIADWGTGDDADPDMKRFFEQLYKAEYPFPAHSLTKLTHSDIARIRATTYTQGASSKVFTNSTKYVSYPNQLSIPKVDTSEIRDYSVELAKKTKNGVVGAVEATKEVVSSASLPSSSKKEYKFSQRGHFDPRGVVGRWKEKREEKSSFQWKGGQRSTDREGFALLSDDEE
ncbi:hypothetical protein HDU79_009877 [Rhizoclosmatium sp. JEL0117]|nr:hypothetical protein HDU79_009877 [Rhizoclosmatium sp. JEL0117]